MSRKHFTSVPSTVLVSGLIALGSVFPAACSAPADSDTGKLGSESSETGSKGPGGTTPTNASPGSDSAQDFIAAEDEPSANGMNPRPVGDPVTSGVDTGCGSNLVGLVRDFHDTHPDMEVCNMAKGDGKRKCIAETGIVGPMLGDDDKPMYAGDAATGTASTTGQAAFDQWFRDVEGINTRDEFTLNFTESENNGVKTFVFDSDQPPEGSPAGFYPGKGNYPPGGFFPIDDLDKDGFKMQTLLHPGEPANYYPHNYHFTFEFVTDFVYSGGEVFTFTGDDDVFVYINRQLVVDLGGIHSKLVGDVDLDALAGNLGLVKGETYPLHFFFAERHETESNFRIETSLVFTSCNLPRAK